MISLFVEVLISSQQAPERPCSRENGKGRQLSRANEPSD